MRVADGGSSATRTRNPHDYAVPLGNNNHLENLIRSWAMGMPGNLSRLI